MMAVKAYDQHNKEAGQETCLGLRSNWDGVMQDIRPVRP